jgi:hypothetical protein
MANFLRFEYTGDGRSAITHNPSPHLVCPPALFIGGLFGTVLGPPTTISQLHDHKTLASAAMCRDTACDELIVSLCSIYYFSLHDLADIFLQNWLQKASKYVINAAILTLWGD